MEQNNEVKGYLIQIWEHFNTKSIRTKSLSKRVIYKASFDKLEQLLRASSGEFRRVFKQPGLYIITWWSKSKRLHKIYIGKSDQQLKNRLYTQYKASRFESANEIFLLPFNTHFNYISYFEKRLIKEFQNLVILENQQINTNMYNADPEGWELSDSDQSRFNKIIKEIKELLKLLSLEFSELLYKKTKKYKLPKPLNQKLPKLINYQLQNINGIFEIQKPKYSVRLKFNDQSSKQIYILRNSYTLHPVNQNKNINSQYQNDIQRIQRQRDELLAKGIIKKINDKLVFTQDYLFNSPSSAAQFITGRASNGWVEFEIKRNGNS